MKKISEISILLATLSLLVAIGLYLQAQDTKDALAAAAVSGIAMVFSAIIRLLTQGGADKERNGGAKTVVSEPHPQPDPELADYVEKAKIYIPWAQAEIGRLQSLLSARGKKAESVRRAQHSVVEALSRRNLALAFAVLIVAAFSLAAYFYPPVAPGSASSTNVTVKEFPTSHYLAILISVFVSAVMMGVVASRILKKSSKNEVLRCLLVASGVAFAISVTSNLPFHLRSHWLLHFSVDNLQIPLVLFTVAGLLLLPLLFAVVGLGAFTVSGWIAEKARARKKR